MHDEVFINDVLLHLLKHLIVAFEQPSVVFVFNQDHRTRNTFDQPLLRHFEELFVTTDITGISFVDSLISGTLELLTIATF